MRQPRIDDVAPSMSRAGDDGGSGVYDTLALRQRAEHWRIEAARATSEAMRTFCLDEAERCERLLRKSLVTPVISGCEACGPTASE